MNETARERIKRRWYATPAAQTMGGGGGSAVRPGGVMQPYGFTFLGRTPRLINRETTLYGSGHLAISEGLEKGVAVPGRD